MPTPSQMGILTAQDLAPDLVTPSRGQPARFRYAARKSVMISKDEGSAFHEAGHATAAWLMGDAALLESIDMQPDHWSWARVTTAPSPLWDLFANYPRRSPELPATTRNAMLREGSRRVLYFLAGPASENAAWLDRPNWFQELAMRLNPRNLPTDFSKAWQTALTIQPSWSRAWRLLNRLARMTDVLIRHPRVWKCIFSLSVAQAKGKVAGQNELCTNLERAWGHSAQWPAVELGPRWRRILFPSIHQLLDEEPDPPLVYGHAM